jgi:hypothetical protein
MFKTFYGVFINFLNKLECLSLAGLSSLVKRFQVRREPIRVKHLSDPRVGS